MSENMMNTTATMNRPVTARDVAEKLGMPLSSIWSCFHKNSKMSPNKVELVRKTAEQMGYVPRAAQYKFSEKKCEKCQTVFTPNSGKQKYCPACRQTYQKEYHKKYYGRSMNYHNGNFKTREEEVTRMKELRAKGYSNPEIAKAIGRTEDTVLRAIGKQDRELWKQNVAMAAHIRAQKNAARKQYVINKPIREYNKRVEAHNKMKAELNRLQTELLTEKPEIMKAAQTEIKFPLVNLKTIQPTALQ